MALDAGKVKIKVEVDDKEAHSKLGDLEGKFSAFGKGVAKSLVGLGASAVTAATTALVTMGKEALNNVAAFEQLEGGIKTLYSEYDELGNVVTSSAEKVMENATKAYETAGMSANKYMETSISFAAALKKSVGGDMDALADYTDMAITDMADNVNKLGTSMESVENAYKGFSRGNFTMLDNLALGYSGTKEGMEELLAKANEINAKQGVMTDYSIDNFSDIVEAIHVVQKEMHITGTTMDEAKGTIEGATNAAKAAWENFLTGVGDPQELADAVLNLGELLFQKFMEIVPRLAETGTELLRGLLDGMIQSSGDLGQTVSDIINYMLEAIRELLPALLDAGLDLMGALIGGLIEAFPEIVAAVLEAGQLILTKLGERMPQILETGIKLITNLLNGIIQTIPQVLVAIGRLVKDVLVGFTKVDWLSVGRNIIEGIGKGILNAGGYLIEAAKNAAMNAFNAAKSWLGIASPSKRARDEIGKQIPRGMAEGVEEDSGLFESALEDMSKDAFSGFAADVEYNIPEISGYAQDLGMSLSYAGERQIVVPLYLNSREIARATAWDLGEQLAWEERT